MIAEMQNMKWNVDGKDFFNSNLKLSNVSENNQVTNKVLFYRDHIWIIATHVLYIFLTAPYNFWTYF